MKVIREQLIEAPKTYSDFQSKYNRSALNEIFLVCLTVFLDCRATNLLRLFSGNLPAMFLQLFQFHGRPEASIAAIFRQPAVYVILNHAS